MKEIYIFILFYCHICRDKKISLAEAELTVKTIIGLGNKENQVALQVHLGSCLSEGSHEGAVVHVIAS